MSFLKKQIYYFQFKNCMYVCVARRICVLVPVEADPVELKLQVI